MNDPLVVTALIAKRAELAGKIEHHRALVRQMADDLAAIDQALRLFKPGFDVDSVRPKRPRREGAYKSKVAPVMLNALREAGRARMTRELVLSFMVARQMDTTNEQLVKAVTERITARLRHMRLVGQIRSTKGEGDRLAWEINS